VPGHTVQRLGARLVLRAGDPRDRCRTHSGTNFFDYPLSIPGEVPLPQAGYVLAAESWPGGIDLRALGADPSAAAVRRDLCSGPLRVRNRRPGDRFRPFGLNGRKKLHDYFVDRKVARQRRDEVPLVVDDRDRIVWVAGFDIDEAFRVTDSAQAVIILRLKLLGGPA
jgi:tRNA(Ile)-lysidine synthase